MVKIAELRILPEDVIYRDKRGFARLSREKLAQISRVASTRGAAKGGASPQVTAARLRRNHLLEWLARPLERLAPELKMSDAAKLAGISRQYLRRAMRKHGLKTIRRWTSFMISSESIRELHQKLYMEYKDHVETYRNEHLWRDDFLDIKEAAKILHLEVWQALPLLNLHVEKREVNMEIFYKKSGVEACAAENFDRISTMRVSTRFR